MRAGSARSQAALAHAVFPDPAPPEVPAPKHLRVAPKVSKRVQRQRRKARYVIIGLAALSAASMFLLVTFHVFAAQSSFQLDKLQNEQADAQRQNELLRNQVASLSSATTISREAAALGMIRSPFVILLKAGTDGGNGGGSGSTGPAIPSSTPVTLPAIPYHDVVAGP